MWCPKQDECIFPADSLTPVSTESVVAVTTEDVMISSTTARASAPRIILCCACLQFHSYLEVKAVATRNAKRCCLDDATNIECRPPYAHSGTLLSKRKHCYSAGDDRQKRLRNQGASSSNLPETFPKSPSYCSPCTARPLHPCKRQLSCSCHGEIGWPVVRQFRLRL